jgi:flagellar basal body rod protein FlgG
VAASKIMLEHCINEKGMHKVGSAAFNFNNHRIESVEKPGFQQEGQLREHIIENGAY